MNSKKEVVKKKNKCIAKKKATYKILYFCWIFFVHLSWIFFLLPCFKPILVSTIVSAFMRTLISAPIPTLISHLKSLTVLLSYCLPTLVSCLRFSAILLFCYVLVLVAILALFLLLFVLDPSLFLGFLLFRTFKKFMIDEPWLYMSTSPIKSFCLFLVFNAYNSKNNNSLYNPTNTNKCKQGFNSVFINFCLLAANYDQNKE